MSKNNSTVPVLPGVTDLVKVPSFANMIDSVVPFTTIWKRPKNKKEAKDLLKLIAEIKGQIYEVLLQSKLDIEALSDPDEQGNHLSEKELDTAIDKIRDQADKKVNAINLKSHKLRDKWFVGFEDLDGVECNPDTIKQVLETSGYEESIGTALSDLAKRKVRKEYDAGN